MDDEQSLLNEPEPNLEPDLESKLQPPDPAAEAFAQLEARVALVAQNLERRLDLLTRAVEHIAMERQGGTPDYGSALDSIGAHLAELAGHVSHMAEAPAQQLTPDAMADQIGRVAARLRRAEQSTITQACRSLEQAERSLTYAAGTLRTRRQQRHTVLLASAVTAIPVMLLWLVYPGWAASLAPQSWLWPEATARRTLGEVTLWDAGERLLRTGDPEAWQVVQAAVAMRRGNAEAIAACEERAGKTRKHIACTIQIEADVRWGPTRPASKATGR